jgi:hypothetical protein
VEFFFLVSRGLSPRKNNSLLGRGNMGDLLFFLAVFVLLPIALAGAYVYYKNKKSPKW